MAKNYTTKTSSLKATIADIRKLNVMKIDTGQIQLDGTDIKKLFKSIDEKFH